MLRGEYYLAFLCKTSTTKIPRDSANL